VTTVERLEREIHQKTQALNESLAVQNALRETLKSNTKTMAQVEQQLKNVADYLKYSNETIFKLNQENRSLEWSSEKWMQRAIQLEFKLLSVSNVGNNRSNG
jgi:septal ring factor EnvC (AmiA/AmiB activator)